MSSGPSPYRQAAAQVPALTRYGPLIAYPLPRIRPRRGHALPFALRAERPSRRVGLTLLALGFTACLLAGMRWWPMAVVGALGLGWLLVRWVRGRDTVVELDREPAEVGGPLRIEVRHRGVINGPVKVQLVCQEQAHRHHDAAHHIATREVLAQTLFDEHVERDLVKTMDTEIPLDAMHSFASNHNAVSWRVAVDIDGVREDFCFRVLPQT